MDPDNSTVPNSTDVMGNISEIAGTKYSYLEVFGKVKGVEYSLTILLGLLVAYLIVTTTHFMIFRFWNYRKPTPVSPILTVFYCVSETILLISLVIIAIIATLHFLHFDLLALILVYIASGFISAVQMMSESYILVLSVFCVTKYYNHFYSGAVTFSQNYWKAVIRITFWLVIIKDFTFLIGLILSRFLENLGRDFFFIHSGFTLLVFMLLVLVTFLYTQMQCRSKANLSSSEKLLCSQTYLIIFFKIVTIPAVFTIMMVVESDKVTDPFIQFFTLATITDIMLVPMCIQLTDIIFSCAKRDYSVDIKMEEVA
ncbi:unnamed protein product [Caenorhabditis brenneri]